MACISVQAFYQLPTFPHALSLYSMFVNSHSVTWFIHFCIINYIAQLLFLLHAYICTGQLFIFYPHLCAEAPVYSGILRLLLCKKLCICFVAQMPVALCFTLKRAFSFQAFMRFSRIVENSVLVCVCETPTGNFIKIMCNVDKYGCF